MQTKHNSNQQHSMNTHHSTDTPSNWWRSYTCILNDYFYVNTEKLPNIVPSATRTKHISTSGAQTCKYHNLQPLNECSTDDTSIKNNTIASSTTSSRADYATVTTKELPP